MKRILECPVCDNRSKSWFLSLEIISSIERLQCSCCGLIFFEKQPEDLPLYNLRYNRHFFRPGDIRKAGIMAAMLADVLSSRFKDPRILEVGPGNGLTAYLLKRMGYDIEAVEEEADQVNFILHTYGIFTYYGRFEIKTIGKRFHLVYAGHVLEHSWDPLRFLKAAHTVLLPKGILYIDTPDNHYAKKVGAHWHHFKTRNPFEHCSLFGVQTLEAIAKKTKFVIEKVTTNPDYQSFQAILRRK